jgi:lipopolysaccharide transport system permease protein
MRPIYASQIYELTVASLKTRYRSAWAGVFWVVCNPIMIFGVQCYAFRLVLRMDVERYVLFLASGLMPWIFIVQNVETCTSLLVQQGHLLKSFPIDPLVLLLAQVLDNVFNFILTICVVMIPLAIYFNASVAAYLLLPVCIFLLFYNVVSVCWVFAVTNVFFRDMRYLVSFLMTIAFFLTPIFYPVGLIPEQFRWVLTVNPFFYMIQPFRLSFYTLNGPEFIQACIYSFAIGTGFFLIGSWLWNTKRNAIFNRL